MLNGTMEPRAPLASVGFSRNGHHRSIEETASEWLCVKRDGKAVPFSCDKVRLALRRCFEAVGETNIEEHIEVITRKVISAIAGHTKGLTTVKVSVEDVQRFVIQQLWAEDLFTAAEHYQNYREQHRKLRIHKTVRPEVAQQVVTDQKHFPTDLQYYQFMSKFSRWNETEKRRETWRETVFERVCPWLFRRKEAVGKLTAAEQQELLDAMYNMEASPAMRVVQMAGPALDRCNVGAYNCAYAPLDSPFAFSELLYILMQGTGQGFSVETDYVSELPRIKKQCGKIETVDVDDSTEGWCGSYDKALNLLWDGWDVNLVTDRVRKKGSRLKTKGGRASGPEPFIELIGFSRNLFKARQGRYLEDSDAHRLGCFTGKIVQVGGVRRAALISLSDLASNSLRDIKSGTWWANGAGLWIDGKYLSMANNSAVYQFDDTIPSEVFMEEWLALAKSGSGERGIFNRNAALKHRPTRRAAAKFGVNPCGEVIMRPHQFCNLSMAIARPDDTVQSLKRKVRIAALFGKIQSLATEFKYIRPDWKKNCEEERLLGVDITGHADCPLLRFDTPDRDVLLRELAKEVEKVDIEFSLRFGVKRSAAATVIKPGGDSSVFFDCASGLSPRFAAKQIRWVRESKGSPVAQFLIDSGVLHAEAPESPELLVFGFPKEAPAGCTLRNDMTAQQQFENWLTWKRNWAEHSVSATIYVEPHEWPRLGALVYENMDHITGLSFLPKDNGTYKYAPNEELSDEQYAEFAGKFPDLNWSKLSLYEDEDNTEASGTFACTGDKCSL